MPVGIEHDQAVSHALDQRQQFTAAVGDRGDGRGCPGIGATPSCDCWFIVLVQESRTAPPTPGVGEQFLYRHSGSLASAAPGPFIAQNGMSSSGNGSSLRELGAGAPVEREPAPAPSRS
jgi:hypothetical protein